MTPGGAWLPSWKPHPATHASPVWTVVLRHLLSALGFPPADKWISIPERFCLLCLSNATMWHDECKPPMGKEGLSRPGQRCICVFLMCSRCFFFPLRWYIHWHPNSSQFCVLFCPVFWNTPHDAKSPHPFHIPQEIFFMVLEAGKCVVSMLNNINNDNRCIFCLRNVQFVIILSILKWKMIKIS